MNSEVHPRPMSTLQASTPGVNNGWCSQPLDEAKVIGWTNYLAVGLRLGQVHQAVEAGLLLRRLRHQLLLHWLAPKPGARRLRLIQTLTQLHLPATLQVLSPSHLQTSQLPAPLLIQVLKPSHLQASRPRRPKLQQAEMAPVHYIVFQVVSPHH